MTEKELQKTKIRERYKGADTDNAEIIPAKKRTDIFDDVERRVAVYVRVSTDNPQQTSSYELQKNYYEDLIIKNPKWTLAGVYADEGISGTSLNRRAAFKRMISDCEKGKIDMVITKNVYRFARNITDCIETIDKLKKLPVPVGVFFETEGIFSLNDKDELRLNFMATMAQEESHTKSSTMNASIEMRFSHGILLTPVLLGYDHDKDGNLIVNESEASTVRLIFFMYLYGYTCNRIADELEKLGRLTKKGNSKWSEGSVLGVLRNERHCGDVLAHKTFTPDYRDHKSRKNRGDKIQYRWRDTHEAIISRADFIAVQQLIDNAKYKSSVLPELKVIPQGALKGFVSINPRWSGFTKDDYITISDSVTDNSENDNIRIGAENGDFDFHGYEAVRPQLVISSDRVCVTFTAERVKFSAGAIRRLENCRSVELLMHPKSGLIAVRPCDAGNKNAIIWNRINNKGEFIPKAIGGKAFLKTLFEINKWELSCRYRLSGVKLQKGNERLLIFNSAEHEIFIPRNLLKNEAASDNAVVPPNRGNYIAAIPSRRENKFGSGFYQYQNFVEALRRSEASDMARTITFSEMKGLKITTADEAERIINTIIDDIKGESGNET